MSINYNFIKCFFLFRDLIITLESRLPTVEHSSQIINNGGTTNRLSLATKHCFLANHNTHRDTSL